MVQSIDNLNQDLFINGQWVTANDYKEVINPATGEKIAQVAQATKEQVQEAIQGAHDAFKPWKSLELKERTAYLHKIADLLEDNADRLAEIMTIEQGKPLKEAHLEVLSGAESFRWNAEEARRLYGETIPAPNDYKYEIAYEPIGVVGAITPWNFPSGMITRKLAPALAAGNTVVLKPSGDTPLSALAIFELFEQAELPKGVANIVMGSSKEIGEAFTSSKLVKKITFTGSTPIGKALYAQSADTLKKMSLELGGHAPFIVNEDADIDAAVDGLMAAKFRNNGQVCIAPNRIFVHQSVQDKFLSLLTEKVEALKVGNGLEEDTKVGPLIREDAIEKIKKQIVNATDKGATLVTGGHRLTGDTYDKGFFFQPTILDNVNTTMDIFYEETFGPVVPIITFNTLDEAISMANDSEYGLASYAFAKDSKAVNSLATQLEYGMVGINAVNISNPETPFGGVKNSGFGRENSHLGIKEYVTAKFINTKFL
ncbi:NAD-dependent succinate-semialdehyde dehydrogenase [Macrococcus equi]|uniref:NAD-dependent succinate-semialdehyde dehydrogenase n=1 Tax=Macrococcus equi TaxID=3395462 RepID=UPI0039BE6540